MPLIAALLLAQVAAAEPADDYQLVNPRAIELFESDDNLMRWALARFDKDGDGNLSIFEADSAAREFKQIADGDSDGRVTPAEYRAARDYVVARYAPRLAAARQ